MKTNFQSCFRVSCSGILVIQGSFNKRPIGTVVLTFGGCEYLLFHPKYSTYLRAVLIRVNYFIGNFNGLHVQFPAPGPSYIEILKITGDFLQLLFAFRWMFSKRSGFSNSP